MVAVNSTNLPFSLKEQPMRSVVEAEARIIAILEKSPDGMSKGILFDHAPNVPRRFLRAAFDKLVSEHRLVREPVNETGLIRYRLALSLNQPQEGDKNE